MAHHWLLGIGFSLLRLTGVFSPPAYAPPSWQPAVELDHVSLYVSVVDGNGVPIRGLPREAFQLWENGSPQEIESLQELSPELDYQGLPQERRWIIFFFSEMLDQRELFRAKRAALWLAERMDFQRDSLAILRGSRMSPFRSDRDSARYLLRYFGVEDGFRNILVSRLPNWFSVSQKAGTESVDLSIEDLLELGAEGSPADLLSSLKHLAGRKQLVYFGTGPPIGRPDSPDRRESLDPLVLADAGFTPYAVDVGAGRSGAGDATRGLKDWAGGSGGEAAGWSGRRPSLSALQERMAAAYWIRYQPRQSRDCRYRSIQIEVSSPQPLQVRHRPGYFATRPATLPLTERTLSTVLERPDEFRDFPLSLGGFDVPGTGATVGDPREKLRIVLSFPLAAIRLEEDETGLWWQEASLFVGVYDAQQSRIGGIFRSLLVRAREADFDSLIQQTATLNEVIDLVPGREPAYLRAIVIVGHNRQIAAQVFQF